MNILKKISLILSDKQIAFLRFILKHKYIPRLTKPRSLSEKIQYIKLYNRNPVRKLIVDRLKVRSYVSEKSSSCKLVNILWSGTSFTKAAWETLPRKCVIKANHGSGMTMIIDKNLVSVEDVINKTEEWMKLDYSRIGREWVYKGIDRYLLVEEMLTFGDDVPPDYKFFVFNQKVELVQVDLDRFSNHSRNLYSRNFDKLDATLSYSGTEGIAKPKAFEKAIRIAEELSVDFDFIRVDLYLIDDEVYFGELTNTPENGFGRISPKELDFELGEKLPAHIKN